MMEEDPEGAYVRFADLPPASTCSVLASEWRDRAEELYKAARTANNRTPSHVIERMKSRALELHTCADELEERQNAQGDSQSPNQ